jgi:hypothetical protein
VNQFTKTLLFLMTFSVFFALLQVLLKSESGKNFKTKQSQVISFGKETIRAESEPIPTFIGRYKKASFILWEESFPYNKKK